MDTPLAYFFTWTVYGTHLQGDDRGWWKSGKETNVRNRDSNNGIVTG